MSERELWVPTARLIPIIALTDIRPSRMTPLTQRKVSIIKTGSQEFMGLYAVDNVLTELGLEHYLWKPQENGGLADIYEDGKQYGNPRVNGARTNRERHRERAAA